MMNPNRKFWNGQQQLLRQLLAHADTHQKAIDLFLSQHAMLHTAEMSHAGLWSFEDEILEGVTLQQMRQIPRNCDHSIAWILWHMTRIEDVTMNLLASGRPQVLFREDWLKRMNITMRDTGNGMPIAKMADLSTTINIEALRAYRLSVGRRTREITKLLQPGQLKQRVDPSRLQQIIAQGAVHEAASDLLDYWGGLTLAGLLLMPPTRHTFIHWNEASRVKQKLGLSTTV
ncbi:MAG: DinB family protein [Anaerolineales bacterium]